MEANKPAHASEQGAGYRLAKLLRDEYWAQTPLDVAKLADEVLSQRPTPAKECCDTKKGFGKCKHDEPTPATASEATFKVCEHLYSRQIDQPYPRHCLKCGERESKPDSASAGKVQLYRLEGSELEARKANGQYITGWIVPVAAIHKDELKSQTGKP